MVWAGRGVTLRRVQFAPGAVQVKDLVPGAMAGAEVSDPDGNVIGRITKVTAITAAGIECEVELDD